MQEQAIEIDSLRRQVRLLSAAPLKQLADSAEAGAAGGDAGENALR